MPVIVTSAIIAARSIVASAIITPVVIAAIIIAVAVPSMRLRSGWDQRRHSHCGGGGDLQ
jgi:hypothetical protein